MGTQAYLHPLLEATHWLQIKATTSGPINSSSSNSRPWRLELLADPIAMDLNSARSSISFFRRTICFFEPMLSTTRTSCWRSGGLDLVFPSPTPSQLQDPRVHPPPVCFNFCQQIVSRLGGYVIIPWVVSVYVIVTSAFQLPLENFWFIEFWDAQGLLAETIKTTRSHLTRLQSTRGLVVRTSLGPPRRQV
jgi:hypothetical protein